MSDSSATLLVKGDFMDDTGKENTDIITSPQGGRREKVGVRFDLIPFVALQEIAKVFAYGAEKYDDNNWKGLDFEKGEQTPLNHALMHLSCATSMPFGSPDRLWELAKAATNITMHMWGELNPACGVEEMPELSKDTPDTPPVLGAFKGIFGPKK